MQRDRVERAPSRARLDVTSLHGRFAVPLLRVNQVRALFVPSFVTAKKEET
jgi:hypothetical protein